MSSYTSFTPRHVPRFCAYTNTRHKKLLNHFLVIFMAITIAMIALAQIVERQHTSITTGHSGHYSYLHTAKDSVVPISYRAIYFCAAFWSAPATGADSQVSPTPTRTNIFAENTPPLARRDCCIVLHIYVCECPRTESAFAWWASCVP